VFALDTSNTINGGRDSNVNLARNAVLHIGQRVRKGSSNRLSQYCAVPEKPCSTVKTELCRTSGRLVRL
jgi:hypothetical protein